MIKKFIFTSILLLVITTSCNRFSILQQSNNWRNKYNHALEYYKKKKYQQAKLLLADIVHISKGHQEAALAIYYLAHCHFHDKNYSASAYYFNQFIQEYPRLAKVEKALYMHGYSLYLLSPDIDLDQITTENAIDILQMYQRTYSNGKYIKNIQFFIKKLRDKLEKKEFINAHLYYHIENYQAAIVALKNFQKSYPASVQKVKVTYLIIDSQYKYLKNKTSEKKKILYYDLIYQCKKFIKNYPNNNYTKEVKKKIQYILYKINKL